ncbi:acetyl-CoA acetyltransferase (plasmid) [Salipiger abyssi]|uniref:Acetyl-CoA acetyltransferase n=1 Tax=Salipiger abyssi TaxID=1250539 RepID=A0A1P8UN32_9RHOB|nr:acetyl-CoA acetyltransferase [Salipiger abyssi]
MASHQRAAKAIAEGRFREQILPLSVKRGRSETMFDTDEHVRSDVTLEDLGKLRPAFDRDGSVTAGNASGINDGAAALVLMNAATAADRGIAALARIVSYGLGGVAPEVMGLGPVPAVRQALARAGLGISDMDVIESNEAFAAQACAVSEELGFPEDKTNPNGGAVALGHPIGASGAILLVKLVYELRRIGGRYGLVTMCIGGGQGIAVVIENAA